MSMESTQSKPCCNTPAIVGSGYAPKGEYITAAGMKTYATGAASSKKAVLFVFDIFGFFPQTLQGADVLAAGGCYQVFMPDFFDGEPADISWYPPDNAEKREKLDNFFKTKAAPPAVLPRVQQAVAELGKQRGIESWGIVGLCWGGKIVNLSSMAGTPYKVAASCHPAMVASDDAPGITIPFAMLPSGDEDKSAVEKWEQGVKTPHLVEFFPDQVHGFMGARSKLDDPKVKSAYEKGYQLVLDFFSKHM